MLRVKAFILFVGAGLILASAAAGASGESAPAEKKGGKDTQVERGRQVYAANCGRCHGADGKGKTRMAEIVEPPDLSDATWQKRISNARMTTSVANGRGQMPSFAKKLSKQDIAAAVAYVRTLRR